MYRFIIVSGYRLFLEFIINYFRVRDVFFVMPVQMSIQHRPGRC
ncbi:hypothetical protein D1BOALGB6SA_2978 [Olavius sp. associated proteobacterium Delta 1]|nr:hypothetical protein D1BOALGB6SA_2978 [Olavius sp. associated proteobacterium Delta 1]